MDQTVDGDVNQDTHTDPDVDATIRVPMVPHQHTSGAGSQAQEPLPAKAASHQVVVGDIPLEPPGFCPGPTFRAIDEPDDVTMPFYMVSPLADATMPFYMVSPLADATMQFRVFSKPTDATDGRADVNGYIGQAELRALIRSILADVKPREREVIELSFRHDLGCADY